MQQDLLKIYDGRNNFWQWDTGQKLIVLDSSIDQVHFSNNKMTYAIVKEVYENDGVRICEVPDIMLKTSKPLMAYAYVMENNQNKTICVARYSVNARPIPEDYTYEETNRFKDLVDKIEAVEDMIESGEGVKRFANIKEAEQWAEESQEVGLIISVKIDSKWIAHIIDSDHSIAKVYDNSDLVTYINRLENLIGDEPVANQIKNSIDVLDLENSYESKGAADKVLIDAKEYAYKLVEDHTVETQRAIEEESARAKKEEEALVKTIHQVNDRIGNIEEETIRDLSSRITGVEAVMDDKITEAISLIMDNPDEAINSINELIDLIKDSSEENIVVDSTLSKEGQAADAKAVGEALNNKQPKGNYLTSDDGNELDNRIKVLEDNKADWNQYDHNAPDYIENRPFYDSNNEVLVDTQVAMELYMGNSASRPHGANLIFEVGAKYRVYFDKSVAEVIANDPYSILFSVDGMNITVGSIYVTIEYPSTQSLTQFKVEKVEELKQLDEKFIPDTIARKTDVLEQVNADWNQNGPDAKDYIKNRPFYESGEVGKIVAVKYGLVFTENDGKYISNSFFPDDINIFKSFADGAKFKVVLGDRKFVSTKQGYYIGNGNLYYSVEPDTGEPFCIIVKTTGMTIYTTEYVNGDQMIIYTYSEQVKQLDEKFIPDSIARKTDISNIPEQVNADWNQNDPSAKDYVKNRPFYDYSGTITQVYDGLNPVVNVDICAALQSGKFKNLRCTFNGNTYTFASTTQSTSSYCKIFLENVISSNDRIYIWCTKSDSGEFDTTCVKNRLDKLLVATITFTLEQAIAHKLDEKFIPDTIARVNDIDEAASTDDEIVDILIQEDMLFAITDSNDSILVDENNNILTW